MKKLFTISALLTLVATAEAQTIAVQRAQHNAAVCSSIDAVESCTDADVIAVVCTARFPSNPNCPSERPHNQKVYSADAAFRTADDAAHQAARIATQKQVYSGRIQRLAEVVFKNGGQNCVNLLTALGISETAVCSR